MIPLRAARARRFGRLCALAAAGALGMTTAACEKVPLIAPTGSSITLTASTNVIPVNGSITIVAQVIEAAGTPPHSGTHVTFTTSLGTVQPSEVETDVSGRAIATFLAGNNNGTATIAALSGGASTGSAGALKILVGTAAVGKVVANASPALVPALGGSSTITATVFDINGNALVSAPVSFTTSAGTLSVSIASTDQSGNARTVLTTSTQATVTASVGATGGSSTTNPPSTTPGTGTGGGTGGGTTTPTPTSGQASATVTVGVASAPGLVITPPTTPPSAGLPAAFTFAVTPAANNGSAVRDLTVDWGDGSTQDLGAINGSSVQTHVYRRADTYTITATLTDTSGNVIRQSASVVVIPVPRPTIIITPSPVPGHVGAQTTITIQVTLPAGITVQDMTIDFGDSAVCSCNSKADLGGATSAAVPHVYTAVGTYTVTVTVTDTSGQTTIGTAVVSIAT